MEIVFCNHNDPDYQRGLNALLSKVFFSFDFWFALHLWDAQYESYAIVEDGQFVSNICVFKSRILLRGQEHLALSIGAVCTLPDYRGRGYSRMLMEHIIARYPGVPMYLSANQSVVDFYPRFGFLRVAERLPVSACCVDNATSAVRITPQDVRQYLADRRNLSEMLDMRNSFPLSMFHLHSGAYDNMLYTLPALGALLVAEQNGETLHIVGLFAKRELTWAQLAPHLPFSDVRRVTFGFMPDRLDIPYAMEPDPNPNIWFARGVKSDVEGLKFPELAAT